MNKTLRILFLLVPTLSLAACEEMLGLCDPQYVYEGVIFETTILTDGNAKYVRIQGGAGGSAGAIGVVETNRIGNEVNVLIHNTCETEPHRETAIDIVLEIDEELQKISSGRKRDVIWTAEELN